MPVKLEQPENKLKDNVVKFTFVGRVIWVKSLQFVNTAKFIKVTEFGIVMSVKLVHEANAYSFIYPMVDTDANVTDVKFVHPLKENPDTPVIVFGIVILFKKIQFWNNPSGTSVICDNTSYTKSSFTAVPANA
jgi:hypothetical protein